jgi:serine/threonine-protein kinase
VSQAKQLQIHHSAVRQQVEKILAHGLFMRSERMGRFLRLAVERSLQGRAADLKEYLIGVEVFDRRETYDPRLDPIVRVEARRLRAKLKAYYEGDGRGDPVIIEFISGSYAPQIRVVEARPEPADRADPAGSAEPGVITVAVLPFTDLSPQPGHEYFSDGLTEELIHALTKVPAMRVVAWNTAAQLRGRQEDIGAIRDRLKAGTVLTGSVRIAGSSLRVRAQLIDTRTGVYLWSETFDRAMQDVFAIQEEIALAIVRTLRVQLAGSPEGAPLARSRSSISSYDYYLKGRYHWHKRTPEDLARSVQFFESAVSADPNSAPAHAGLADAYTVMVDYGLMSPAQGMPLAKVAAGRAVELDPGLAEAYTSLASIRFVYDREWEDAERLYLRAIALNPGYATAHHWYGVDFCANLGRFDQAAAELEIAGQLDPLSAIIREGSAFLHLLRRDYDAAVRAYHELAEFAPSFYKAYTSLGRTYAQQGKYLDAIAMLEKGRTMAGNIPNILGAMGQVYALAGEPGRARDMIGKLTELAQRTYVPASVYAVVYLGLGEHERALDCLERGCEQRDTPLTALKVHPIYDPLRAHPRFQNLLKRLRLE